jgi:hypothetical protein
MLNWNKAFLSDRTQTVVINDTSSTSVPVTSDVPRGVITFCQFLYEVYELCFAGASFSETMLEVA